MTSGSSSTETNCNCAAANVPELANGNHEPHCASLEQFFAIGVRQCYICKETGSDFWCEHLTEYVRERRDASELDFGIRFQVPIIPSSGLFCEVQISSESINNICAPVYLITPDLFGGTETENHLGLWTVGEGMWSIRSVILDWVKHRARVENSMAQNGHCPSSSHGFAHQRAIQKITDPMAIFLNNWTIATYGLCTPQYQEVSVFSPQALVPQANDSSSTNDVMQATRNRVNNGNK